MPNKPEEMKPSANGDPKPHLSPSALATLSRCGEQYRRRYIEGDRIPPGMAALKGVGVHRGIKENFDQKIESHTDLKPSDIVDAAVAGFDEEKNIRGYELTSEEVSIGVDKVLGEAVDATARMAQGHAELQAPSYQPVMVEQRLMVPLPGATHDLLGIIDVLDDKHRVTDFKTGAKSKPQGDADSSLQLSYYAAAVELKTGRKPVEARLDVIIDKKSGPDRQVLRTQRDQDHAAVLVARVNAALSVIQAGAFVPTDPTNWWCSARWCGYHSTCPYAMKTKPKE